MLPARICAPNNSSWSVVGPFQGGSLLPTAKSAYASRPKQDEPVLFRGPRQLPSDGHRTSSPWPILVMATSRLNVVSA
jgi:hypothetical protein